MCGIAGFLDYSGNTGKKDLIKITDVLNYRGPDDSGYEFWSTESVNVGLGHRRLSIIDLSQLGHQPMHFENLVIAFNGEVYNFLEIKSELEKEGYSFKSTTDTEVILKAFHKWGIEAVNQFNGMFAIALYDKSLEVLYLIRDRMGIKPLFYYYDGKNLVFASELKAIMEYPFFEKRIDYDALNIFLYHGYIPAPYSIFESVYKLEPGNYLVFKNGEIMLREYWNLEEKFRNKSVDDNISKEEIIDKLDEIITSSVKYRMISDVPLGAFLSGGYDSSIVTAIMQKISSNPINSFTIGFNEKQYNEANYAKEVANHLGTKHYELYLPIKNVEELIKDIPLYYDEPFADSSQLPTLLVSKLAKQNVTVVLSGDGGDEMFCGYNNYDIIVRRKKYKSLSKILRSLNNTVYIEGFLSKFKTRLNRLLYLDNDVNILNSSYLISKYYLNGLVKNSTYEYCNRYFELARHIPNIQEAGMLQDMLLYLPNDILTKVDRATMSVSLEGRVPLLDYRLVEYSLTIPHELKYCNGEKKYILKQLAYRYIPEKLLNRTKMGFGVPVFEWLHKDLTYLLDEY
ncbi:asparagine synthase (glutamine-hydrolyzing), partial [Bacteroidales bacterium AH-315-N07]|nr:asparagine synthase (glutamine-hydrolyzing) [Bacteroidales bacterium AH-315-N07]